MTTTDTAPPDLDGPRATFPIRPGLTLWLAVALLLAQLSSAWQWAVGERDLATHLTLSAPTLFFYFICIHDAVHGVLHRNPLVSQAAGTLFGAAVALPFDLLQSAHLRHHHLVGDPDDPEYVVYGASPLRLLLRLVWVPLYYLRELRQLGARGRLSVALHGVGWGVALAVFGAPLLIGWLLPVALAVVLFGLATVYVPHSAHRARLMQHLNLWSGYHHDHHRDPRYPAHQYGELRLHGIERLGVRPTYRREREVLRWASRPLSLPRLLRRADPAR